MVMTGDGELQEGQIWESLQTAAYQKVNNLIAIVDFNKIQTDKFVNDIIDLGDLKANLKCSAGMPKPATVMILQNWRTPFPGSNRSMTGPKY